MPRLQVRRLYDLALPVVVEKLKDKVNEHRESCQVCDSPHHVDRCNEMDKLKHSLKIPSVILCDIYKEIMSHCGRENEMKCRFIYSWLLENPELVIAFICRKPDDKYFFARHGKYVRSIDFVFRTNFNSNQVNILGDDFWKSVVFFLPNIQVLNLRGCPTAPNILEHIGRECRQIQRVEELNIGNSDFSASVFRKLCFRDFNDTLIKNDCCKTLERFDLDISSVRNNDIPEVREVVTVLLQNILNLKYLGRHFSADYYFQRVVGETENIIETNIEKISTSGELIKEILPLLRKFCPKLRSLKLVFGKEFRMLHDYFPNLETFSVFVNTKNEQTLLFKVLTNSIWLKLENVYITSYNFILHVELSDFAKNLPKLQTLTIIGCKITWTGRTSFRFLKNVNFELEEVENINWISSFASSVEKLQLYMEDGDSHLDKDICKALLVIPLPNLIKLDLDDLLYDFEFITRVIITCQSLKYFSLYNLLHADLLGDVYQFVQENNYDCKFD